MKLPKLPDWSFKQWLELSVTVVAILLLAWAGYVKWYLPYAGPQSHRIQGQLKTVSQYGLDIEGVHVLDDQPQNSDFAHPEPIMVKILPSTKFVKTIWHMPTREELAKTKGIWYPDKLKKDQLAGSIDDLNLVQGMLLTIKTLNNSFRDKIITASEVDYIIREYPY